MPQNEGPHLMTRTFASRFHTVVAVVSVVVVVVV